MRGINQAKRKCVYHEGGLSHLLFRKSMINKLFFSCSTRSWKNSGKGGLFPSFCAASSCVVLGDRSIHHPFSFSNSFFHCSEIGPRKDGLFGSSKMHCTQVSVCEIVMLCHVYTSFFLSDTSKRIPCESQSHLTIGQMAFPRQMSRAKNERREKEKKGNVIRRSGGGQDRWIWRLKKVHLSSTLWNRRKIICHREREV